MATNNATIPEAVVLDALSLEYKRDYGTARGDLNVADLVNDPTANGRCRVFGLGAAEHPVDLSLGQLRSLFGAGADGAGEDDGGTV